MSWGIAFLLAFLSTLVVFAFPAGLIAIESRRIKSHQFRMVTGSLALGLLTVVHCLNMFFSFLKYDGIYYRAYDLLQWLTFGLGSAGILLASLAIWAMLEAAWNLHRRAGMFGLLSGTVSGLSCLLSLIMILWS